MPRVRPRSAFPKQRCIVILPSRDPGSAGNWQLLIRRHSPMSDPLKTDARRWERIQELFEAGLPLPPDARRAMLARCSDDEAILAEVQTLLERSSPTGDRLVLAVEEAAHAYLQRNE